GVRFGLYFVDNAFDASVFVNDERGAVNAVEQSAHKFFRAPDAKGFRHFFVRVAEQHVRKFVLDFKFFEFVHSIGTYAYDLVTLSVERLKVVAQIASLSRTTGCMCARIKKHYYFLANKIVEFAEFAVLVKRFEIRSGLSGREMRHSLYF